MGAEPPGGGRELGWLDSDMTSDRFRYAVSMLGAALFISACGTSPPAKVGPMGFPHVDATTACSDWWAQSPAMQLRTADLYRNMAVDSREVPTSHQLRDGIDVYCRADSSRSLLEAISAAIAAYQRSHPVGSGAQG